MSEVALQVGGRSYKLACADGEEEHLRHLAGVIDEKLATLGPASGVSEAQGLLFAALFLADELVDARRKAARPAPPDEATEVALEIVADRLEALATALENTANGT